MLEVGDKVKVLDGSVIGHSEICWPPSMFCSVGELAMIIDIEDCWIKLDLYNRHITDMNYSYAKEWLELIKKGDNLKVGDRVRIIHNCYATTSGLHNYVGQTSYVTSIRSGLSVSLNCNDATWNISWLEKIK